MTAWPVVALAVLAVGTSPADAARCRLRCVPGPTAAEFAAAVREAAATSGSANRVTVFNPAAGTSPEAARTAVRAQIATALDVDPAALEVIRTYSCGLPEHHRRCWVGLWTKPVF